MSREDLPDEHIVQNYLGRMDTGLDQARDLMQKLLTFSRPEDTASDERVELAPLIQETLDLAAPSIPSNVEVHTDLSDGPALIADAGQLRQVVMNLVTNAGQAMETTPAEDPSVLDVRLKPIDVDPDMATRYLNLSPGAHVQLSVSDTGPGMDADTKSRIFDPFFTTKASGPQRGTGLGLSVVHGIVQALDGEITVYTQPGEGTTFNVYLPIPSDDADISPEPPSETAPATATGASILVVDDDESVTELESIRLPRLGYEVTTCATVSEALELLRDPEAYDLLLTDYNMPGRTGLDLTRRVRERGLDLPVVLMSGFQAQVSAENAEAVGVDAVLQKPVGRKELAAVIAQLTRPSSDAPESSPGGA